MRIISYLKHQIKYIQFSWPNLQRLCSSSLHYITQFASSNWTKCFELWVQIHTQFVQQGSRPTMSKTNKSKKKIFYSMKPTKTEPLKAPLVDAVDKITLKTFTCNTRCRQLAELYVGGWVCLFINFNRRVIFVQPVNVAVTFGWHSDGNVAFCLTSQERRIQS